MALYEYQCIDCAAKDKRIAGLDDSVAICHECGGLMWRRDVDPFIALWDEGEGKCSQKK
jgi:putative FmdB family regulatory protein